MKMTSFFCFVFCWALVKFLHFVTRRDIVFIGDIAVISGVLQRIIYFVLALESFHRFILGLIYL